MRPSVRVNRARHAIPKLIRDASEGMSDRQFDQLIEGVHDDVSAIREAASGGELIEELERRTA